jgi:hypothetical protein
VRGERAAALLLTGVIGTAAVTAGVSGPAIGTAEATAVARMLDTAPVAGIEVSAAGEAGGKVAGAGVAIAVTGALAEVAAVGNAPGCATPDPTASQQPSKPARTSNEGWNRRWDVIIEILRPP